MRSTSAPRRGARVVAVSFARVAQLLSSARLASSSSLRFALCSQIGARDSVSPRRDLVPRKSAKVDENLRKWLRVG
jgi:hypothetical protein